MTKHAGFRAKLSRLIHGDALVRQLCRPSVKSLLPLATYFTFAALVQRYRHQRLDRENTQTFADFLSSRLGDRYSGKGRTNPT